MDPYLNISKYILALPEIFLAIWILFFIILGIFYGGEKSSKQTIFTFTAALGLIITFILVYFSDWRPAVIFSNLFVQDRLAVFMKLLVLFTAVCILFISEKYRSLEKIFLYEYPLLILFSILGMLIMISANDFLTLYMGLELQSLSLYVLAAIKKDSQKSSEAGLKYFILGALASGFYLYGVSMLFGISGTTTYTELSAILNYDEHSSLLLSLSLVMILSAIAFKLSAAPYHMWTPDVYEGSPTSVTAFIAVVPKIAAVAILMRILFIPFSDIHELWHHILVLISILSIFIGALGAILQINIKRLMAYSTIGSIGYVLLALSTGTSESFIGALLYITIYIISVLGCFTVVVCMEKDNLSLEKISDLSGLAKTDPFSALCFAILLFSLAGLPPLAGFIGKFYIFRALIFDGFIWLAILGILASVISAYYYLRIVKIMYLDDNEDELVLSYSYGSKVILGITSILAITFVLYAKSIVHFIEYISMSVV